jgi:hypothetical protein
MSGADHLVRCTHARSAQIRTGNELSHRILRHIADALKERNFELQAQFKRFDEELRRPPKSTELLVELVRALRAFNDTDRPALERECVAVTQRLNFLFEMEYEVGVDVLAATGKTFYHLRGVDALVRTAEANIAGERVRLLQQRDEQRNTLQATLDALRTQVSRCEGWGKTNERLKYMEEIAALKRELEKAETEIDGLNKREALLGLSVTDFWVLTTTKVLIMMQCFVGSLSCTAHAYVCALHRVRWSRTNCFGRPSVIGRPTASCGTPTLRARSLLP